MPQQCDGRPLTRVEVRRDVGQGLVTLLTLGIVNPATLYFACAKAAQTSPISCETIEGTGGENQPPQIRCTKNPTGDDAETIDFDCTATSNPADPDRIAAFSCAAVDAAWFEDPANTDGRG